MPGARASAFFGGPDRPARALRDLLEARIAAVGASLLMLVLMLGPSWRVMRTGPPDDLGT